MAVYAKKVDRSNPVFKNRSISVTGGGMTTSSPVPDNVTLCNGCNSNVEEGYFIYLDKKHMEKNIPYDYYCESCQKNYFPDAVVVTD